MKIFVIDGYNVIYSLNCLKRFKDIDNARFELIGLVRERFGSNYKIIFDGKIGTRCLNDPSIIYTSENQEADDVIHSIVSRYLKRGYKVFVVSRDKGLIEKCKRLGADSLDPHEIIRKKSTKDKDMSSSVRQKITNQIMKELGIDNGGKNERI
ncbi:MAG: NYN domain-containing protein [candidate division WOR-3 bacterium]